MGVSHHLTFVCLCFDSIYFHIVSFRNPQIQTDKLCNKTAREYLTCLSPELEVISHAFESEILDIEKNSRSRDALKYESRLRADVFAVGKGTI